MILTIDTGGTKTLLATFGANDLINREVRFATPRSEHEYIAKIVEMTRANFDPRNFTAIVVAVPGVVENNVVQWCGNLPWRQFDIAHELRKHFPGVPVWVENDANLAGLAAIADLPGRVHIGMYLTLSTGIGAGIIVDGKIAPGTDRSEVGHMLLLRNGRYEKWESFASGQAFFVKTGMFGADVNDTKIWREYAKNVSAGLLALIPVIQPEAIVLGGSMGTHFAKYGIYLTEILDRELPPYMIRPSVSQAIHPERVVNFGARMYAEQRFAI